MLNRTQKLAIGLGVGCVVIAIAVVLPVVLIHHNKNDGSGGGGGSDSGSSTNNGNQPCVSDCKDKECGSDGCSGTCGNCALHQQCSNNKCIDEQKVPYQFRVSPVSMLNTYFNTEKGKSYSVRTSWVGIETDDPQMTINGNSVYFSTATEFMGDTVWRSFKFDPDNTQCTALMGNGDDQACINYVTANLEGNLTLRTCVTDLRFGQNHIVVKWKDSNGNATSSTFTVYVPSSDEDVSGYHLGDPNIGYGGFEGYNNKSNDKQNILRDQFTKVVNDIHFTTFGGDNFYDPAQGIPNLVFSYAFGENVDSSQFFAKLQIAVPGNHDYIQNGSGSTQSGACGFVQFYPFDSRNTVMYSGDSTSPTSEPAWSTPICSPGSALTDFIGLFVVGKLAIIALDNHGITSVDEVTGLDWETTLHPKLQDLGVVAIMCITHWDSADLGGNFTTEEMRNALTGVTVEGGKRMDSIYSIFFNTNHGHFAWQDENGFEYSWNGLYNNGQHPPAGTGYNSLKYTIPKDYKPASPPVAYEKSWLTPLG